MPASAPRPDEQPSTGAGVTARPEPPTPEARSLPYQWNLLAWAALVGTLTGLAIVAFHFLLGFINNFLYGPFVEWLLAVGKASSSSAPPELPSIEIQPLVSESGTPLKALLQLGLGSLGLLGTPPPAPAPVPLEVVAARLDPLELWPVVVVPTLGGLAVGLLRWIGGTIGPGLPSLMPMAEGTVEPAPRLPWMRLLAASLSLGSGASLGPEGPSVESGGNLGLWIGQRGGLSPQSRRALVAAGAAAGLAAGFKAPIAGVFFAFEGSFSAIQGRPSLRAVLVAAVASSLVTQLCLGDAPILRLPAYEVRSLLELPLYLGLGLLASLMSWALVSLMAAGNKPQVQRIVALLPPGLATALGGAAVGGMALAFPQVLGVGYDTIEALLGRDGGIPLLTLVALIGVKLLATAVSNATGFVGGGFAPSLFLGAVLGSCYGQFLGSGGLHLPVAEPPAYAMVGMAAVLAGSARAPLTALLLLFELTRDIRIVLPLMAAAGLSAVLVERWLGFQATDVLGQDLQEQRRRSQLAEVGVCEALEPSLPPILPADLPAGEALARLLASHGHCLLVVEAGSAVGLVTLADLRGTLMAANERQGPPQRLIDCRRGDLVWLPLGARLDQLEDQLTPDGLRQVPVFAIEDGVGGHLPQGLPATGLPIEAFRGMASRDGMARALAARLEASGTAIPPQNNPAAPSP